MARVSKVSKKRPIILAVIVLLVVAAGLYEWHSHHEKPEAQTTSKQPSARSNFTGGTHTSSPNSGVTQGGATDNKGDQSASSGETGVSSSSGVVTVVAPASGGALASGDVVRGTAKGVNQVQYRLVDNDVGVIAQGPLSVVNGTFSGTLQFKAHATSGQLDVFTYNSQYQEINEVQLPVALEP